MLSLGKDKAEIVFDDNLDNRVYKQFYNFILLILKILRIIWRFEVFVLPLQHRLVNNATDSIKAMLNNNSFFMP